MSCLIVSESQGQTEAGKPRLVTVCQLKRSSSSNDLRIDIHLEPQQVRTHKYLWTVCASPAVTTCILIPVHTNTSKPLHLSKCDHQAPGGFQCKDAPQQLFCLSIPVLLLSCSHYLLFWWTFCLLIERCHICFYFKTKLYPFARFSTLMQPLTVCCSGY